MQTHVKLWLHIPLLLSCLLQMIPIESFEVQSMTGKFVPVVPGGGNIRLTYHNRKEFVEKALHFRLHELEHSGERISARLGRAIIQLNISNCL